MAKELTLTLSKDEMKRVNEEHAQFHHAYGITMSVWAGIERALFYWFQRVTGLKIEMARGIFYSARSFNGRAEMLEAAAGHANLSKDQRAFLEMAIKRAWSYNGFRNRMAHGEPIMNVIERRGLDAAAPIREMNWSIAQGKSDKPDPRNDISMAQLIYAADNYHLLRDLLIEALKKDAPLERYLQQVAALPSQPDSKAGQI